MDIAILWKDDGADIALDGADLVGDEGLETSVVLSLFCDRRASDDEELPDGVLSRGGFFGDAIAEVENDLRGSSLWLLKRETRRPVVLERARRYAEQALAWMLEDGVARRVEVQTSFFDSQPGEPVLIIEVTIFRPTGESAAFRWAYHWEVQLYSRID